MSKLTRLLREIRGCRLCADDLPVEPRPVLQASTRARLLICGQAPGRRVHESGIPFDDPSGVRLRGWLGIDAETFYDPGRVAIVPMAFCYPGTGRSGDRPPPPICAATWLARLRAELREVRLTLVVGAYAQRHWLATTAGVTETVRAWREQPDSILPLPHPSPRNALWLRRHPWFECEVLPELRRRVERALR